MKKLAIGLLTLVILSYAGCHILYPTRTVNFRMTYEVETPEGLKTGSGILAATWERINGFIGHSFLGGTKGEAVVVDLGPRGTLYALLSTPSRPGGDGHVSMLIHVFDIADTTARHEAQSVHNFAALSGRRELTYDQPWIVTSGGQKIAPPGRTMAWDLPILVRFKDEADPRTVEAVDPANLAATFGAGVSLKRVIIETTKEFVTTGIQNRLTWLGPYPEPSLDPDNPKLVEPVANAPLKRLLRHGHFRSYAP